MAKILVTGGAGYIGTTLIPFLLDQGHTHVRVVDNLMYKDPGILSCLGTPGVEFINGDVRDQNFMDEHAMWADVIVPLAALVGMPLCERERQAAWDTNYYAIANLGFHAEKHGKKMIYPNTNSGYGIGKDKSFCTEEDPLEPISVYGETKCMAEGVVVHGVEGIAFRLATVFGVSPRMRTDLLVNNFVYRAMTEGSLTLYESHFKRNYVHVKDVARAICFMIEHYDEHKGNVFNLGLSDANLSKKELAEKIGRYIPIKIVEAQIGKDPDQRNYIVSNEKIESTGFQFTHSLDYGIMELMNAYKALIPLSMTYRNY